MDKQELLEKSAELFGLRKTVSPDGGISWRENKSTLQPGWREELYVSDVNMIQKTLGFGAIILQLGMVDFTTGSMQGEGATKYIWLTDGRKITLSAGTGAIVGSISNEPDKNKPSSVFIDKIVRRPTISKCLHPLCDVMVDRTKRKSGCCSKAHMSFECTEPKCVKRANSNGWTRMTHPFGTKIAEAHWEFRKS